MKEQLQQYKQHCLAMVSHVIPFIAGGGILIVLSIIFMSMTATGPDFFQVPAFIKHMPTIGATAFQLSTAVLAGLIAYGMSSKAGLVPRFVGSFTTVMSQGLCPKQSIIKRSFSFEMLDDENMPEMLTPAFDKLAISLPPKIVLIALLMLFIMTAPQRVGAAYAALYGGDGNDFVGFTGNSAVEGLKTSGWNGLIMRALSVQTNGDITYNNGTVTLAHNGAYVGPSAWGSNVALLKLPPTTVTRYEVALGGAGDVSFANIKSLVATNGTGSGSILYKNFQALKNAVPGIDAINDDDER